MFGQQGDSTNVQFYNGNRLCDMWGPYGLKKLGTQVEFDLALGLGTPKAGS
jgi:hypothetical protein